ncbi:hypothetical protein [Nonomuraea aridisoli]|uniref:Secreted protein n=1 Tax=Nonomuraea aridisoli TaxID=2070368 RepID=A0A2W2ES21_9ACTN|nr:hypothetical protein [Nonomuraea aridisoli]PZG12147.1 hypothetical protein C1J01_33675 [Nonomuraea aridisoli]
MFTAMRIAAAAGAVALLPAALPARPAAAGHLRCDTFVHAQDSRLGIASCANPTDRTWMFRAVVVCGRAPDVMGGWVTVLPGRHGESQGYCGGRSTTGVSAVGVDERPA